MATGSGSMSSAGNNVILQYAPADQYAVINLAGAFTGAQVAFSVSADGVNYTSVLGSQLNGAVPQGSTVALADNSTTTWRVSGLDLGAYLQVQLVAISTGTVTATLTTYGTLGSGVIGQNNASPPLYQDQPMGNVGTPQDYATGTAAAATVTYNAVGGQSHVISSIILSYSAATPTGGNIQIKDGASNVIFNLDITAQGPQVIPFYPPKQGSAGQAMTVTLASGSTAVVGKVNVNHWVVGTSQQGPQPLISGLMMDFESYVNSQWVAAM